MSSPKPELTLFEAACIVAGLGIGGGVMAVPYLASFNGMLPVLAIIAAAYCLSLVLHLMVAELITNSGRRPQLVELFREYLFQGRWAKVMTWIFFVTIIASFYTFLAAYLMACGQILHDTLGISPTSGQCLTYAAAASVVFFGLKVLGHVEKWGVLVILTLLAVLTLASLRAEWQPLPLFGGSPSTLLAYYGVLMFAFSCLFSIPEAAAGLGDRVELLPRAVVLGISINLCVIVVLTVMSRLMSNPVTPVAITGWAKALGPWALNLSSIVVMLALLTSYWGFSYAIAVVIQERLHWNYPLCWLCATVPTLIIALSNLESFIGLMQITGGATALVVTLMVIPALRKSRRELKPDTNTFAMGKWGGTTAQIIIIAAHLLMAAGSLIKVN